MRDAIASHFAHDLKELARKTRKTGLTGTVQERGDAASDVQDGLMVCLMEQARIF